VKYVLFVCNHNAGRSQMAQALFERHAPDDVRAESAGSTPAKRLWPNVVEAMRELDIDISGRRPRKLTVEMQLHADWAVTMGCGEEIRACADAILADYQEAPVRSFVMTIAHKRTRQCLAAERCDPMATI
jgi:protein-tyrosine-phosphatase